MGPRLGLFHVERFRRASASRMPRLAVWAGKRPGHSQRPLLARALSPTDILWALRLARRPLPPPPGRIRRESHLECGRPLESILRGLPLCPAVLCCWRREFCVCQIICCYCGCCVAASSALSWLPPGLTVGWPVQFQDRISCLSPVRSGRIFRKRFPALPGQGLRQHLRPRPAPLRGCEPGGYCCAAVSPALSAVGRSSSRIGSLVCRR